MDENIRAKLKSLRVNCTETNSRNTATKISSSKNGAGVSSANCNFKRPSGYSKKFDNQAPSNSRTSRVDYRKKEHSHNGNRTNFLQGQRLVRLLEKDETEILFTLLLNEMDFKELLSKEKYEKQDMCLILNLIGKASQAVQPQNVSSFVHSVMTNRSFLLQVQIYLLNFHNNIPSNNEVLSFRHLTIFIKKFQELEPSDSTDAVLTLLPLLQQTCNIVTTKGISIEDIKCNLNEIEKERNYFMKKYISEPKKVIEEEPPENYRTLSILPTVEDIKDVKPFLRPNIIEGRYANTEHYLDVQFRLLREDYVRPLRDGIQQFLMLSGGKKVSSRILKNLQDIRVYYDFKLLYPSVSENGVVHVASFDVTPFGKINWESSKRFLTGSLICFSDNNFQTFYLASIAKRDSEYLKQGLLLLKFESIASNILNFDPSRCFVMVETQAYFEAYRHNLRALREMNEHNLPMQKYIVEAEKEVENPRYMSESSIYDLSPLIKSSSIEKMQPLFSAHKIHNLVFARRKYNFLFAQRNEHNIDVLRSEDWPNENECGLDKSQYEAVKSAVTKEFCVIQGPPGTGKTFIGLKIAEILLKNYSQRHHSPILVVCYTNHALDQFLEGILCFSKTIGRVGGRCCSEVLEPFQVSNLRRQSRKDRDIPFYVRKSLAIRYERLNGLVEVIQHYSDLFYSCVSKILLDYYLLRFIRLEHYNSLMTKACPENDGRVIMDWLGLLNTSLSHRTWMEAGKDMLEDSEGNANECDSEKANCSTKAITVTVDAAESAEVDYIEAMRDIDGEDFIDVKRTIRGNFFDKKNAPEGEWIHQFGKKQKKYVKKKLNSAKAMSPNEVNAINNIWKLSLQQRWSLYMYWQQSYMKYLNENVAIYQKELLQIHEQLQEMRNEEDVCVLRKCSVIGMTTTGAAKYRDMLKRLKPEVVIFEEAAEVFEAHVVTSLTKETQHVIMIGDHQQLRPNPTVYELARKYKFDVSLFERMVKNGMECHRLNIQHRMRPSIASLLTPHIYSDLENHSSVLQYENVKGVSQNVFFINHSYFESVNTDLKSHANMHEAKFIVEFCQYLLLQGYNVSQITILTTYSGQMLLLSRLIKEKPNLAGVRATVVDNYQGEENDIILISFVRSNEDGRIGFLKTSNRVCVALSRAKKGLYCIGNFELLADSSELWKKILIKLESQKSIGNSVKLCCQNHPGTYINASTSEHFDQAPDGGCMVPCGQLLSCGHICIKKCHPVDLNHEEYKCMEKCKNVLCEKNHQCPLYCHEDCKPCMVKVPKIVPMCKHESMIPCHKPPENWVCQLPCEKVLQCGHSCPELCGFRCSSKCRVSVQAQSPCGHEVTIQCFLKSDPSRVLKMCNILCEEKLECGHKCIGKCSKCLVYEEGIIKKVHKCESPCKYIFNCGHRCNRVCGEPCLKCSMLVSHKYTCGHVTKIKCSDISSSNCKKRCAAYLPCGHVCSGNCFLCKGGLDHVPCEEIINRNLSCGHKLPVSCSQPDEPLCQNFCLKVLPCGHKCAEKCCEPCSKRCEVVVTLRKACGHMQSDLCFEAGEEKCKKCTSVKPIRELFQCDELEAALAYYDDYGHYVSDSSSDDFY